MGNIFHSDGANITQENPLSVNIAGANSADGEIGVVLKSSEFVVPVDVQVRTAQTIQTHNAVALTISSGATPTSGSAVIDCEGFGEVGVIQYSTPSHNGRFQLVWSSDGTNFYVYELPSGVSGTTTSRSTSVPVKARYLKILVENQDATVAPTVSASVYLKP